MLVILQALLGWVSARSSAHARGRRLYRRATPPLVRKAHLRQQRPRDGRHHQCSRHLSRARLRLPPAADPSAPRPHLSPPLAPPARAPRTAPPASPSAPRSASPPPPDGTAAPPTRTSRRPRRCTAAGASPSA